MKNQTEKITDKIRKLLAKADTSRGATDAEAKMFLAKAQELMTAHGIESVELDEATEQEVMQDYVELDRKEASHDRYAASIIKRGFGVGVLWTTGPAKVGNKGQVIHPHQYILVGTPADVEVVKLILPRLLKYMRGNFSAWCTANGHNPWSSKLQHSYYAGLVSGYVAATKEGAMKAKQEAAEAHGLLTTSGPEQSANPFALVLLKYELAQEAKQDAIRKFIDSQMHTRASRQRGTRDGSAEAYFAGVAAGKRMDLSSTPSPCNRIKG